jgi:hypothetical protein
LALNDAQALPAYGAAFTFPVEFRSTTGALITNWTDAALYYSNDGGANWLEGTPPVEGAAYGLGVGVATLDASQMSSPMILVKAVVSNVGATAFTAVVYTLDLSDTPGVSAGRFDRMFSWVFRRWRNTRMDTGLRSGELVVYRDGGESAGVFSSGTVVTSGTRTQAGEMS